MRTDFNSYADAYARNRSVQPNLLRSLLKGSRLAEGDRVLEIGCGTANYLSAVVAETGATGYGIDPSQKMLDQAKSDPARANLSLTRASAEGLPFPDGMFDVAYSVDVIHHISDRPRGAAEALRVLKLGGRYCVATDSAGDIAARVPLSSHFPETVAHEQRRYPQVAVIEAELSAAGFGFVVTESVVYEYPLTDLTPYRERAFSSLRLITDEEVAAGVARLERDLAHGPIPARSLYTLIWATRP